ncbi:Ail/Lom family outer membrane beta-barrel protein [Escherichia coli]
MPFYCRKARGMMRKVCAAILSAAICLAVSGAPVWASEHQSR